MAALAWRCGSPGTRRGAAERGRLAVGLWGSAWFTTPAISGSAVGFPARPGGGPGVACTCCGRGGCAAPHLASARLVVPAYGVARTWPLSHPHAAPAPKRKPAPATQTRHAAVRRHPRRVSAPVPPGRDHHRVPCRCWPPRQGRVRPRRSRLPGSPQESNWFRGCGPCVGCVSGSKPANSGPDGHGRPTTPLRSGPARYLVTRRPRDLARALSLQPLAPMWPSQAAAPPLRPRR